MWRCSAERLQPAMSRIHPRGCMDMPGRLGDRHGSPYLGLASMETDEFFLPSEREAKRLLFLMRWHTAYHASQSAAPV
jgi:hypothetical protein